jgi:hypothetical protein
MIRDRTFGAAMESIFLADLRQSREIRLPAFQRRSRRRLMREDGASVPADLIC